MNSPRYATHQRLLRAACGLANGPIVEFGAGDYSTVLINDLYPGRTKITIENKLEWILHLSHYALWDHTFVFNPDPFFCVEIADNAGVVFVDCDPANRRADIVRRLSQMNVGIVVVHDTEPDSCPEYNWGDFASGYKYQFTDSAEKPWTTALSNTIDVTKITL